MTGSVPTRPLVEAGAEKDKNAATRDSREFRRPQGVPECFQFNSELGLERHMFQRVALFAVCLGWK